MADKKKEVSANFSEISYILGIVSIVMALFQPLAGLIFGIIGLTFSRRKQTGLSKKSKTLNIIGIVLSLVLLVTVLILSYYLNLQGINTFFPSA